MTFLERPGYRLPTEAEWEYVCRAGKRAHRFFGDCPSLLPAYAWYASNAGGTTHPVGRLKPNPFGLFDMYGNASEWCHSLFYPFPSGDVVTGWWTTITTWIRSWPKTDQSSYFRGGAFSDPPDELRSANRLGDPPGSSTLGSGFRIAKTLRGYRPR